MSTAGQEPVNPYAVPGELRSLAEPDDRPRYSRSQWQLAAAAILFTGALALGVFRVTAEMTQVYEEFDNELPSMTIALMNPAFTCLVALLFVLTLAKEWGIKSMRIKTVWNKLAIAVAIILAVVYPIGIFLPLASILYKLQ